MLTMIERLAAEKIMDSVCANGRGIELSIHEIESAFLRDALGIGLTDEKINEFLMGGDI